MLYDLADGPPPPGTLLELVLTIIAKRRQEIEFLKTRVLTEAILAPSAENYDGLKNAYKLYRETALPFVGHQDQQTKEQTKKLLDKWTSKVLKVRPLWLSDENRKLKSQLRKQLDKVRRIADERSRMKLTRM